MTHFEYISVAVSIILALGIARLLDGIGPALRKGQRYWVHVGWMAVKFFNIVIWWWALWTLRGVQWNFVVFVYQLIGPVIIYLQTKSLVTPSQSTPDSWRVRFEEIRVWFFVGNIVLLSIALVTPLALGSENPQRTVVPVIFLLANSAAGLVFRDGRVQAVVVVLALLGAVGGVGGVFFDVQT